MEIINFSVSGFGAIDRPKLQPLPPGDSDAVPRCHRPIWFNGQERVTPIYDRGELAPGARLVGPAIVEEFGSTTVAFPGQALRVDDYGIMIITADRGEQ